MQNIEAEYLRELEARDPDLVTFQTEQMERGLEQMRDVPADANREWFYYQGLKNMAKLRDFNQKKAVEKVKHDVVSQLPQRRSSF